jgi:hypothetical protein
MMSATSSRLTGPCFSLIITLVLATTTIAAKPTVLRIRTANRGVIRFPLPNDDPNTTLSSILASAGVDFSDFGSGADLKCQLSLPRRAGGVPETLVLSPGGTDGDKTAAELGLEHGSIITILPPSLESANKSGSGHSRSKEKSGNERFDPFPHLAKSASASRRLRALARSINRGMTYGDISRMQSAMHSVEAQSKGPLTRVYVCSIGAARFRNRCTINSAKAAESRVALLFGTINKEAVDPSNMKKARTSLSSTTQDDRMCEVAKVHAIWEPPSQKPTLGGSCYDEGCLLFTNPASTGYDEDNDDGGIPSSTRKETAAQSAIRVAGWLGLRPVGWMFSYCDDRNRREDGEGGASLPVHGHDAIMGAKLQIEQMKCIGREDGRRFVTLALDCREGTTEAFQLSDNCVQMVAEGVLSVPSPAGADNEDTSVRSTRFITLMDPVIVSGEETKLLDSVLLLVNLAMLSHVGLYSGGAAAIGGNVKRSSGALLAKTSKRILAALEQRHGNDGALLKELCDFDVLLALDSLMGREESEKLCSMVRKYASGQRKSTVLDDRLKLKLQTVIDG